MFGSNLGKYVIKDISKPCLYDSKDGPGISVIKSVINNVENQSKFHGARNGYDSKGELLIQTMPKINKLTGEHSYKVLISIDFKNEKLISEDVKNNKQTFRQAESDFSIKKEKHLDDLMSTKMFKMDVDTAIAALPRVSGGSRSRIRRKTRKSIRKSRRNLRKSPKSIRRYRR